MNDRIFELLSPHGDLTTALAEALHLARLPRPPQSHELVTAIEGAFDALRELRIAQQQPPQAPARGDALEAENMRLRCDFQKVSDNLLHCLLTRPKGIQRVGLFVAAFIGGVIGIVIHAYLTGTLWSH